MNHRTPQPGADSELAQGLAKSLGPWFARVAREMTWRGTRDPYAIWVSEIMLQQTRVDTVERYYANFLQRFPDVGTLAAADEDSVLAAWSGLGYYRRARLLHQGARYVAAELGGRLPKDGPRLRKIPGVGPYTAGAIASIAFDRPEALVDGNVARVLSRVRAVANPKQQGATACAHWALVSKVLESGSPRVLAQALMELGATVCTPKNPSCERCPVVKLCAAYARDEVDRIPAPRTKVAQPVAQLVAIAVVSRRRLLMVRRPPTGLLAGLWCLPLIPRVAELPDPEALAALVGSHQPTQVLPAFRHVFTHRIWDVVPMRFDLPRRPQLPPEHGDASWLPLGETPVGGLPSITAKLLKRMFEVSAPMAVR